MTCKINADTSDGLKIVSDTSGAVDIQSNGTTKVTIDANGNVNTVGQVSTTDNGTIVTRQNAKPLIINGDMEVAQRGTSKTGITSTTMEVQDRFSDVMGAAGTWTQTKSTDVPTGQGFTSSMKWDCTTAKASLDAGSVFSVRYIFEGQDVQLLKYGSSNAEKLTLSFWIKSPKTGTHILSFYQYDDARHVSKAYTISSANTYQKVVCSIPGDTTGVIDNDNGAGLGIEIGLSAGSTYTSGTLATSWAAYSAANQFVGQVNCADSTDNNVFITGVQLEIGEFDSTTIPPFQHELFGDNLARCQRYFQKSYSHEDPPGTVTSGNRGNDFLWLMGGNTSPHIMLKFVPELRVTAAVTTYSIVTANTTGKLTASTTDYSTGTNAVVNSSKNHIVYATESVTAADDVYVSWTADAEL